MVQRFKGVVSAGGATQGKLDSGKYVASVPCAFDAGDKEYAASSGRSVLSEFVAVASALFKLFRLPLAHLGVRTGRGSEEKCGSVG